MVLMMGQVYLKVCLKAGSIEISFPANFASVDWRTDSLDAMACARLSMSINLSFGTESVDVVEFKINPRCLISWVGLKIDFS